MINLCLCSDWLTVTVIIDLCFLSVWKQKTRHYVKTTCVCVRVLIVDWDVHHGQGIQYLFQEDPR